ncbi:uncharacterized serine-rich protein C215.13-like [Solanum stenotomum]|uniref:uncharacterized serine-rich protein C215.13-like n=1 Tax=Solanum stenotomum TaxID=172797 RepID=UPI0020D0FEC4|nr:uncharacterized serine-rich protein C215.13-like [Solanum stenotomum]
MVMEGIQEDIGDGNMQCMNHPYKNSSPGGICALCLQEKLGKLVSSSFSSSIFPSSSSSSSSRSDFVSTSSTTTTSTLQVPTTNKNTTDCVNYHPYENNIRKSKMHFLKKGSNSNVNVNMASSGSDSGIVLKRSKSTTTPRNHLHYLEANESEDYGPHRKGFWSFLHYSSSKHYSSTGSSMNSSKTSREKKKEEIVVVEENESPNETSFNNKVARSRSVGCGSRSFSGDLFEKISTGFGDCTLRRIESQRESKPRFSSVHHKERVNCGGILSYLVSSEVNNLNGKSHHIANGRSKNWGWALASPMRAFSKTSSSVKREDSNSNDNKNATPNLDAIPSLLTVSS